MTGYRWRACLVAAACAGGAGVASGGSAWFALNRERVVCDVVGSGTCTVELAWTVGNDDRFDKWKICWKEREASTWLEDDCEHRAKIRKLANNFYAIPNLEMGKDYRIKLEGRRERNEHWTCVQKTMIRDVDENPWLDGGGWCTDF